MSILDAYVIEKTRLSVKIIVDITKHYVANT